MIKSKADLKNQAKEIVDELNKEFEDAREGTQGCGHHERWHWRGRRYSQAGEIQGFPGAEASNEHKRMLKAQKQLQQELHDTTLQLQADENKNKQQKLQEQNQMIADYIGAIGDGLSSFFESQDLTFHNFLKTMLTTYLDAIEKQITATYAAILADSILHGGWQELQVQQPNLL